MTEHWLVRVSKAWKIISDSVRGYYVQSNKRRLIESMLGYSGSLTLSFFLIFSVVLPIPFVEGAGFDAAKPTLLHALAGGAAFFVFPTYGRWLTQTFHFIDEIPIRYIKYLIKTRKNLRDLK